MADDPSPQSGYIQAGPDIIALQSTPLPVLYFDSAPGLSHLNGIIGVTLTVSANVPDARGKTVVSVAAVVAHLKCNIPAARELIGALHSAILLAQPVENPEGPAN